MRFNRAQIFSTCVFAICAGAVLYGSASRSAAKPTRISDVLNVTEPYTVLAVLPSVTDFIGKLRSGAEMRAFFDSPLGLHFLRSAPLRGAAHLHRLISLAPKTWQWNLYTLISDGPVFYASQGQKFVLVVALNRKGQLATNLISDAHAQKFGEWLIIASDKDSLNRQLEYMKKPVVNDSGLDAVLSRQVSLGLELRLKPESTAKRSLLRGLLSEVLAMRALTSCTLTLTPDINSLQLEGSCPRQASESTSLATLKDEKINLVDHPAFVYYQKPGHKAAHYLSLNGLVADYGYLIPQILFSGPSTDQKAIEFLSQAFKTRSHKLESSGGGLLIRYPYAYAYDKRKFDTFAPHLVANRERFFWQTFLPEKKLQEREYVLSAQYHLYANISLYPLIQNSQAALKQFDAVYSPGHFNEFRDALTKSSPVLKNTSLRLYSKPSGKFLRIGGALTFAENS